MTASRIARNICSNKSRTMCSTIARKCFGDFSKILRMKKQRVLENFLTQKHKVARKYLGRYFRRPPRGARKFINDPLRKYFIGFRRGFRTNNIFEQRFRGTTNRPPKPPPCMLVFALMESVLHGATVLATKPNASLQRSLRDRSQMPRIQGHVSSCQAAQLCNESRPETNPPGTPK